MNCLDVFEFSGEGRESASMNGVERNVNSSLQLKTFRQCKEIISETF